MGENLLRRNYVAQKPMVVLSFGCRRTLPVCGLVIWLELGKAAVWEKMIAEGYTAPWVGILSDRQDKHLGARLDLAISALPACLLFLECPEG